MGGELGVAPFARRDAAFAVVAIQRDQRAGWLLGIGLAASSFVLYIVQETIGLSGLEHTWRQPTRILLLLLAALVVVGQKIGTFGGSK